MKMITILFLLASIPRAHSAPVADYSGISRWNISASSPNLTYYVDPSLSGIAAIVTTAFANWSTTNIPSEYLTFSVAASASAANIVLQLGSVSAGDATGYASDTYNASGNLTQCTVNLSNALLSQSASNQLLTVTHEVGHCLGLDHSVVAGAVMSYRAGNTTTPTADDQYAVTVLYPKSGSGYPSGCATVKAVGNNRRGRSNSSHPGDGPMAAAHFMLWSLMILGYWQIRKRSVRDF